MLKNSNDKKDIRSELKVGEMNLIILGCGSAKPTLRHNPSSQIILTGNRGFLIDCGEGTQLQMEKYKISPHKITDIFISHLHGDHFLGLPGLLGTLCLEGRETPIRLYMSEKGCELINEILSVTSPGISENFIEYHSFDPTSETILYEDSHIIINNFPLYHRVPASGFFFKEKEKERHIKKEYIEKYCIPFDAIKNIKKGADWITSDGEVIPNGIITDEPTASTSYAYCSDTIYSEDIAERIRGVETLYHEATYDDSRREKAFLRGHSTAKEAGMTASIVGAHTLIIGHYSKSILDERVLVEEAEQVFDGEVIAANEGMRLNLNRMKNSRE